MKYLTRSTIALLSAAVLMTGCFSSETRSAQKKEENKTVPPATQTLKVLLIGNSYSFSTRTFLPAIAKAERCKLDLVIAGIGGCTLERHIQERNKSLTDPQHKPYRINSRTRVSLDEALKLQKWDVIAIQQASHKSWKKESFQPWADQLIALIRKTNPQAEIVIQQTWSYNGGDIHFKGIDSNGEPLKKTWNIDQKEMYEKLTENYLFLAKANSFRVVPVGLAVQYSRVNNPKQFPRMTPAYKDSLALRSDLPKTEDVVGEVKWSKNKENKSVLVCDMIHLNREGQYLQACVWFGFLFNRNPSEIKYIPAEMSKERVLFMRQCARKALENFKQIKNKP